MFKRVIKELKQVQLNSDTAFRNVYRTLKHKVQRWQEPYELIKKNNVKLLQIQSFQPHDICRKSV